MPNIAGTIKELTGLKPDEQTIALGLMSSGKTMAAFYTAAVLESANPELRHLFTTHLNDALQGHERISRLAIERGWYPAQGDPEELVRQAADYARESDR